jgi:hypothetical protein
VLRLFATYIAHSDAGGGRLVAQFRVCCTERPRQRICRPEPARHATYRLRCAADGHEVDGSSADFHRAVFRCYSLARDERTSQSSVL